MQQPARHLPISAVYRLHSQGTAGIALARGKVRFRARMLSGQSGLKIRDIGLVRSLGGRAQTGRKAIRGHQQECRRYSVPQFMHLVIRSCGLRMVVRNGLQIKRASFTPHGPNR